MLRSEDILFLLCCLSIRSGYLRKASIYSSFAMTHFPDDLRIVEVRAYCLIHDGEYAAAEELLKAAQSTKNIEFLRLRAAILLSFTQEEKEARARSYLSLVNATED